jgi:hypothetical protein
LATTLTITPIRSAPNRTWVASWNLSNGEAGDPFENPGSPDRSVQVGGTFGAGGTIVIEGSNDGTNYRTLTDPQGNALSFTSANLEAVQELTRFIRGRVSAGDGTTAIAVHILASGNHRG